jgi:hypothetical protein
MRRVISPGAPIIKKAHLVWAFLMINVSVDSNSRRIKKGEFDKIAGSNFELRSAA